MTVILDLLTRGFVAAITDPRVGRKAAAADDFLGADLQTLKKCPILPHFLQVSSFAEHRDRSYGSWEVYPQQLHRW